MQSQTPPLTPAPRAVAIWLTVCLITIASIVVIGGLTRLTESGLSIVEWKPITGILPPMGDDAWTAEFNDYQATPQFKKSFPGMDVMQFRHIYWLEYVHRLLGRFAGLVFLLPLIVFAVRRRIDARRTLKLACIFALGGVQGVVGWYMVKSGLMDDPHVSSYRLALHLGLGFALFGLILWQLLSISYPRPSMNGFILPHPPLALKLFALLVLLLIFMQVLLGALTAGLHAGLTYNTFPMMDGQWLPEGLMPLDPWWRNVFEDVTTVQFDHRMMAYSLCVVIPLFWLAGRNNPHVAHLLPILFSIFVIQFLLGILTLLFVVPVPIASLHQTNALLLFAISVTILHRLFIPLISIDYSTQSLPAHA